MNILLVCSGNVSRSFMAEMLLRNEIEQLGLDNISVSSAGLFAYPGSPPDPKMVDYLLKMGISTKSHEARQIMNDDVDWADLILVMEREHAAMVERSWPEAKGRVELLGKFVSDGQTMVDDIPDPFGKSSYHYRLAQAQITMAIRSFVKRVLLDPR
jgi:protein-tyrosine phosphatase